MAPVVALVLCVVLVTALLLIERRRNTEASWALWVPTLWMLICGSRPVGLWFEHGQSLSAESVEAGSPLDRLVLSILIIFGIIITYKRNIEWDRFLKDNAWLILLYLYLGLSIMWSDFPFVSFKRWVRISGGIPIALVVLSERSPFKALESVLRRSAYVLVPFSLMLIKYFGDFGREYNRWSGDLMWVGVSTQKNGLGQLCTFSVFFLIWGAFREKQLGDLLKNKSQAFADALVVGMALFLLRGPRSSYSATAIAVLVVGAGSLLLLNRRQNLTRWVAAHLKAFVVALGLMYLFIGDALLAAVSSIAGRDKSLTGRTDIWSVVLDVASRNPLFGTGYGGFWGLGNDEIRSTFQVNQAHNGYLGVYLEIGVVGIMVLFAFLMAFCSKVRRELDYKFYWGTFGISFLLMVLLYNFTEDNFLKPGYLWTTVIFVTIVFSNPACRRRRKTDCT